MSLPDDTFLASIDDDVLKKKYSSLVKNETIKIRKSFKAERQKLKDNYDDGINILNQHDELLNIGIFPFIQNYPPRQLGYKLRQCDPLHEDKKCNFDYLIIKEEKSKAILIFGEAKIDKDHFDSIIEEVVAKIRVVQSDIEAIKTKYLSENTKKMHIEYVILVRAAYVDKAQNAIEKKLHEEMQKGGKYLDGIRIVLWKADVNESWLERAEPGHNNPFFDRLVHADANLNSRLVHIDLNGPNVLEFFPQSHIVKKLSAIIPVVISNKARIKKAIFTVSELRESLEKELGYIHASLHESILKEIVGEGLEIGLLEKLDSNTYKVKEQYSGSSLNAKVIRKEWVKFRLYKELQRRIETMRIDLQMKIGEEFRTKPRTQSLEQWFEPRPDDRGPTGAGGSP